MRSGKLAHEVEFTHDAKINHEFIISTKLNYWKKVCTSGDPPEEEKSLIFSFRSLVIAQFQVFLSRDGIHHVHEEDGKAE